MAEETNEQKIQLLSEYAKSLETRNEHLRGECERLRAYAIEKEKAACIFEKELKFNERAALVCGVIAAFAVLVAMLALAHTFKARVHEACPSGTAERVVEDVNAQIGSELGERLARARMDAQYYIGRTRLWLARGWENVIACDGE